MHEEMKKYLVGSLVIDTAVVAANIIEQYLLLKNWKSLHHLEKLLISLSLSDLLFGVFTIGLDALFLYLLFQQGDMGNAEAWVILILEASVLLTILISIFHVFVITIERLIVICRPTSLDRASSPNIKKVVALGLWLIPLTFIVAFSVARSQIDIVSVERFVIAGIFSVVMLFVTLAYIVLILYMCFRNKRASGEGNAFEIARMAHTRRATFICILLSIAFVVCIGPITMGYFDDRLYHHMANILVNCNALVNPIVYIIWHCVENCRRKKLGQKSSIQGIAVGEAEQSILFTGVHQQDA